jgi:ribosomal protein S18 acetylase RimI-like enzyme
VAWMQLAYSLGAAGVHLGVAPTNAGAIAFYARLGLHRLTEADGAVFFGAKLPFAESAPRVSPR